MVPTAILASLPDSVEGGRSPASVADKPDCTTWPIAVAVLAAKPELPEYWAVMKWPPLARIEVVNMALPPYRSSVSMAVVPS